MTKPKGLGEMKELLATVLARAEKLLVNDERAAEIERSNHHAAQLKRQMERLERLERGEVPLTREVHQRIVRGLPLMETISQTAVQHWLTSPRAKPVLILCGGTGCGKTTAADWAIANGPASSARIVCEEFVRVFAAQYGEPLQLQHRLKHSALCVVDDVGREKERDREAMAQALVELLDARKGRRTILTTNQGELLNPRYYMSPRLSSRLHELAQPIIDDGPDLRLHPPVFA